MAAGSLAQALSRVAQNKSDEALTKNELALLFPVAFIIIAGASGLALTTWLKDYPAMTKTHQTNNAVRAVTEDQVEDSGQEELAHSSPGNSNCCDEQAERRVS